MRSHAIVLPQFWTGSTGKAITAAGKDTRILATYLLTCDHSNMIGLYRLPLLYATEETGLKRREILSALDRLRLLDFALYDLSSEFIWVREMARIQLGLLVGETLKDGDKRAKGVAALYKHLPVNPFLGPFHDRYAAILRLPLRRDQEAEKKALGSPFYGASEPLARGPIPDPDPDLLRKGETGETKSAEGNAATSTLTAEDLRRKWNQIPGVKPCKTVGPTIRDRIRTRLREHPEPAWWNDFFKQVGASDFLTGRTNGTRGTFQASLDWILKPANLDKLQAGNYDNPVSEQRPVADACTWPLNGNGRRPRPCGQPIEQNQPLPVRPFCPQHLAERQRIDARLAHREEHATP